MFVLLKERKKHNLKINLICIYFYFYKFSVNTKQQQGISF